MLTITRLAFSATKTERKFINGFSKILNKIAPEETDVLVKTMNEKSTEMGKTFLPYSKNIFTRTVNWVKSFKTNYSIIKNFIKNVVTDYSDAFGANFTPKRQKLVKKLLKKKIKINIKKTNENFKSIINEAKDEIKKPTT